MNFQEICQIHSQKQIYICGNKNCTTRIACSKCWRESHSDQNHNIQADQFDLDDFQQNADKIKNKAYEIFQDQQKQHEELINQIVQELAEQKKKFLHWKVIIEKIVNKLDEQIKKQKNAISQNINQIIEQQNPLINFSEEQLLKMNNEQVNRLFQILRNEKIIENQQLFSNLKEKCQNELIQMKKSIDNQIQIFLKEDQMDAQEYPDDLVEILDSKQLNYIKRIRNIWQEEKEWLNLSSSQLFEKLNPEYKELKQQLQQIEISQLVEQSIDKYIFGNVSKYF